MKTLKIFTLILLITTVIISKGQTNKEGQISPEVLQQIKSSVKDNSETRALINAVTNNKIKKLAVNHSNVGKINHFFSNKIETKAITNQKSSGRCWLFTGLNTLRPIVAEKLNLSKFEFSETYSFFYDQLEKSNLFLESIISTRDLKIDDRKVEWLFKNAIGDGGQWTTFADIVNKYGLVPSNVMPETSHSESTGMMSRLLRRKLREFGVNLREMHQNGNKLKAIRTAKVNMLSEIYKMLVMCLGEPPVEFSWQYKDKDDKISEEKKYTPKSFYNEFVGIDLNEYVMIMNDPTREYFKLYEVEYDRSLQDGNNWKYINLPIKEIKEFAKNSILGNDAMYFSCDVGKQLNTGFGTLDLNNYDYDDLFGVKFDMDKSQRISTYESGSTHGMALVGVNILENGEIDKWLLENSWGADKGHNGYLTMTDSWFGEYLFRVVISKKYLDENTLKILDTKAILLPPWDPMFAPEK